MISVTNNDPSKGNKKVIIPQKIYVPEGSTSFESLIASEVAMSWLAGDIASIMQLGCQRTKYSTS